MVCCSLNAAPEKDEKGRCSHQEQRPSPGDFVRIKVLIRTSVESPALDQPPCFSYAGWQTDAFTSAIPNAYRE